MRNFEGGVPKSSKQLSEGAPPTFKKLLGCMTNFFFRNNKQKKNEEREKHQEINQLLSYSYLSIKSIFIFLEKITFDAEERSLDDKTFHNTTPVYFRDLIP